MFEFLKKTTLAAIAALGLVFAGGLTGSAFAATFDPTNTLVSGGSYDILANPLFFNSTYVHSDAAGFYNFTFTNSSATAVQAAVTVATVNQFLLRFATTGVTFTWLTGGNTATIAQNVTGTVSLSTTIASLGSDTLRVVFGNPTQRVVGGRGTIDLAVAAVVPLPAGGLLLLGALGGIAALRRRKTV